MLVINQRIFLFLIAGFVAVIATSCSKWVQAPPPINQVTATGAFANDRTADATVAGLYSRMMEGNLDFLNGALTLYPALSADELYRTSPNPNTDAFTNNALTAQNTILSINLWNKAYAYIYQSNACLEGLATATTVSESTKQRLRGEVLFVRAITYFYLVNLFGDVPLELATNYKTNAITARTPTQDVYAQIAADLTEAKTLLSSFPSIASATRPSEAAASALLARVYLWKEEWAQAESLADAVINSGTYQLETPDNVFLSASQETIFQLTPVTGGVNTAEGLVFIPYSSSVIPTYTLQDSLLAAFEPGDIRKQVWLSSNDVNGTIWYYPARYKVRSSDEIIESNVVLRLAEMYLIRAEARAEQGKTDEAIADVNVIRERAGLLSLPAGLTQSETLIAISQENRIEFFAEWGHRWLDLKRKRQAVAILSREKSNWQPTDALYPIPYSQILLNQGLVQNEGY